MQIVLQSRLEKLELFVSRAINEKLPADIQSSLFKFGTVLICGYIERSVEIIILERLSSRAQPRVLNFIKSHFKKGPKLDCAAIEQLLLRFDTGWAENFAQLVNGSTVSKDGVTSCYSVRNSVAHGGPNSTGSEALKQYLEAAKQVVEFVISATK